MKKKVDKQELIDNNARWDMSVCVVCVYIYNFFSKHKSNINDNFEYQVQYQNSKINKSKGRVIYRPTFKLSNSIADGPQMTCQLTWQ
jgi:UDP-N-acetylenolpyruvoylglucosamine reductase